MAIEEDPPAGVPEWVVTYGDMMSLLLTFFIMLVSMSKLKEDGAVRAMLDSIRETFGDDTGDYGAPGPSRQRTSIMNKLFSMGARSQGGLKKGARQAPGPRGPHKPVRSVGEGTVVTLGGPVMFGRFDAVLSPELQKDLEIVLEIVADKPNRIEVRGHASPEPLPEGSAYQDQLDLSFARAHATAEFLIARGIARSRVLVSAAGDAEPRQRTRDPERQLLNHRVDVFLIDAYIAPPDGAAPEP